MSVNLDAPQVAANQNQKEVTINDATGRLDAAMTEVTTIPVDNSNAYSVSALELRTANMLVFEDDTTPPSATVAIDVPAIERGLFVVYNNMSQPATVEISGQSEPAVDVASGDVALVHSDGIDVRPVGSGGGGGDSGYDVGTFFPGAPGSSELVTRFEAVRDLSFPSALTDSSGRLGVAATAQTDFDIQKNGSSVGTMRFAASGTIATFISASGFTLTGGDRLDVVAPASPDATAADLSFTLKGSKV